MNAVAIFRGRVRAERGLGQNTRRTMTPDPKYLAKLWQGQSREVRGCSEASVLEYDRGDFEKLGPPRENGEKRAGH